MADRKDTKLRTLKECIIFDLCNNNKPIIENKIESFMKLVTISINGWLWDKKEDIKHYSNEQFMRCLAGAGFHTSNIELAKILEGMMQAAFLLHISSDNEKAVRAILMTVNELDG
jgi:hypothetical protein